MSEVTGQLFEPDVELSSSANSFKGLFDRSLISSSVFIPRYFDKPVKSRSIHLPRIEIMGVPFSARKQGERIVLESDRWPSLRSSGDSVSDAISDMQSLLADVVEEYVLCSEDSLSEDAKDFRHYLISTLI
jgi:hypothetical protein